METQIVLSLAVVMMRAQCNQVTGVDMTVADPLTTTMFQSATIRPSTAPYGQSAMGDQNARTWLQDYGTGTDTLVVSAYDMSDPPSGTVGDIQYVIVRAMAVAERGSGGGYSISEFRAKWTVGSDEDSAAFMSVPNIYPAYTYGEENPLYYQYWGNQMTVHETAHITSQPNGRPWTWAAICALETPTCEADITAPSGMTLKVGEYWIDVYGRGPGLRRKPIKSTATVGLTGSDQVVGIANTTLYLPDPMRFTLRLD